VQEGCGTNVSEHSTSLFRFDVIGVRTRTGKVTGYWLLSPGWGRGVSAASKSIRESEHGTVTKLFIMATVDGKE